MVINVESEDFKEKQEKLMKLLKELEEKTDLEAGAVVTRDGLRLACSVSAQMDADIFSAAAAAMVNLGSMTIRRLNQGELKEIIIKGDQGYTLVTEVDENTMLVAAGRQSFRLGYYIGVLKRYAQQIAEIMREAAPVEKVAPPKTPVEVEDIGEEKEPTLIEVEEVDVESISDVAKPAEEKEAPSLDEKSALERERKAILEALKALGWEEPPED
ncbi:MAG: roadblock/LC7 domain-containing protein [Candidatus Odinarchaeia archaeon]